MAAPATDHRAPLLGTFVDVLSMDGTIGEISRVIDEGRPVQHVVLNAAKVVAVQDDERLAKTIASCGLINADGMSVVWAGRLLGVPLPERVTGIDLMYALLEKAQETGWRVYFFGATEEVLAATLENALARWPRLDVAGSRNGYFSDDETPQIVQEIAQSGADILFVGMPSPRKEYWIAEHLDDLGVSLAMGVGGSFDVLAGVASRAPIILRRAGLEWFHRFLLEPRRMWRRYLFGNARFMGIVARAIVRRNAAK